MFIFILSCKKDDDTTIVPETVTEEPSNPALTLKDVAGNVWMGMLYDQTYDTIDTSIFNREVNAGQVTWYPGFSGWNGAFDYDFSELNNEVNYVDASGIPIMMHMLFGPNQYLPDWFKNGNWTNAEMEAMMQGLIQNIIQSNDNASKVEVWNIVNEAISWDGDLWEDSKWLQLGYEVDESGLTGSDKVFDSIPVYIRYAFEYARMYTDKELELRDYLNDGLESRWGNSTLRTKSFYQLTKHLINKGVPIDAVGFQGHFNIDVPASFNKLTETVQKYKTLGLKVYITELDAEQNDASTAWNATISQRQADYYYNYVYAALQGGVDGIFTWGVRDDQDPWWRFGENPLLFDANGDPKDSYFAVRQAFIDFNN
jgi:endo-1,4-beta-xylanase